MALTLIVSFSGSSLVKSSKSTIHSSLPSCSCSSFSINSSYKTLKFHPFSRFSQLGFYHFTPWNGLKHMGISISAKPSKKIGKGSKCRGKVVYASLFGVGAPEALVIGVVALLVFGPKGLAEVARNLGKTLRAFQPTIKELQEVSREFKNTLEREISLDDDPIETKNTSFSNTANPTSTSSFSGSEESVTVPMAEPNGAMPNNAYSSDDYLNVTEEQLKARQEALSSSPEIQLQVESEPQASVALEQDVLSSSPETMMELESQTQDNVVPNKAYTSEEYLKVTEEQLTARQEALSSSPESQVEAESQTQVVQQDVVSSPIESSTEPESTQAVQETANVATSVQKPEDEV